MSKFDSMSNEEIADLYIEWRGDALLAWHHFKDKDKEFYGSLIKEMEKRGMDPNKIIYREDD